MRWLVTAHQSLVASLGLLDVGTPEDICGDGDMEIALCFFPIVLGHLFVFVGFFSSSKVLPRALSRMLTPTVWSVIHKCLSPSKKISCVCAVSVCVCVGVVFENLYNKLR